MQFLILLLYRTPQFKTLHLNISAIFSILLPSPIMISHVLIWLNYSKLVSSTFLSSALKYLFIMVALRCSFPPSLFTSFIWWFKHLFLDLQHQTAYFDLRALHVFDETYHRSFIPLPFILIFHILFISLSSSVCFLFSGFSLTGVCYFCLWTLSVYRVVLFTIILFSIPKQVFLIICASGLCILCIWGVCNPKV